jgi:hypothetical protein
MLTRFPPRVYAPRSRGEGAARQTFRLIAPVPRGPREERFNTRARLAGPNPMGIRRSGNCRSMVEEARHGLQAPISGNHRKIRAVDHDRSAIGT